MQLPLMKSPPREVDPNFMLIYGLPKVGKALKHGTPVLTDTGFKNVEDLTLTDRVAGSDGEYGAITGIYPQGKREVFQVIFADGTVVECSGDHLWTTFSRKLRHGVTLTTKEMLDHYNNTNDNDYFSVPLPDPIQMPKQKLSIDPYTLGLLIGDGSLTSGSNLSFSEEKRELLQYVPYETAVHPRTNNQLMINVKGLYGTIKKLGLDCRSYEKVIPEAYLQSSINDRLALLQGLIDTDGTPKLRGGVEYSTTSLVLANQVKSLVKSLGGKSVIRSRMGKYRGKDGFIIETRENYRVVISFPAEFHPTLFRLPYKQNKYVPYGKGPLRLKISEIIKTGELAEHTCISVDTPDHLFVCSDYILTHNTTCTAQLQNALILDTEDGTKYIESMSVRIIGIEPYYAESPEDVAKRHNKTDKNGNPTPEYYLYEVLRAIAKAGKPYDYLVVDTVSRIDEWSEILGTLRYMRSDVGKKWNRDPLTGNELPINHPDFVSIHTMGNGYGYRFSRAVMVEVKDRCRLVCDRVIFNAHVKDKMIQSKSGTDVVAKDIALTGAVKGIYGSNADAIGYLFREDKNLMISFEGMEDDVVAGGRCAHLRGKTFQLMDENNVADWSQIFSTPARTVVPVVKEPEAEPATV